MTKSIKLALVAAMAMGATSAFATNGDALIGTGAKSRAMGGTGVAHYNGSESATTNPALITKSKGTHFTFGGTYFRPSVEVQTSNTLAGSGLDGANDGTAKSDAKHNVIPYVSLTENLGNGWAVGASMFGSAGMGTDWRSSAPLGDANMMTNPGFAGFINQGDQDPFGNYANVNGTGGGELGLYSMRSNLLLLKFSVPIAYGQDNWSVGIAPVLMYGSLDISFQSPDRYFVGNNFLGGGTIDPLDGSLGYSALFNGGANSVGNGSSSSFGLGLEIGGQYTLPDMGVTLGATYHSSIEMEYKGQISTAASAFGYGTPGAAFGAFSDKLEQPAEYALGVDWTEGDISLTADWKNIRWGNARGYQDFGWENQNVYALGAEFRMDDLALRLGYNYAKNPIKNSTDTTAVNNGGGAITNANTNGDTLNALNAVMFPAITERHYTIGAGYQFTKNVGADLAVTYATSPDATYNADSVGLGTIKVTNDQIAVSANLNYSF